VYGFNLVVVNDLDVNAAIVKKNYCLTFF